MAMGPALPRSPELEPELEPELRLAGCPQRRCCLWRQNVPCGARARPPVVFQSLRGWPGCSGNQPSRARSLQPAASPSPRNALVSQHLGLLRAGTLLPLPLQPGWAVCGMKGWPEIQLTPLPLLQPGRTWLRFSSGTSPLSRRMGGRGPSCGASRRQQLQGWGASIGPLFDLNHGGQPPTCRKKSSLLVQGAHGAHTAFFSGTTFSKDSSPSVKTL